MLNCLNNTNGPQSGPLRSFRPSFRPWDHCTLVLFPTLHKLSFESPFLSQDSKYKSPFQQSSLLDFVPVLLSSHFTHVPRSFTIHSSSLDMGMADIPAL